MGHPRRSKGEAKIEGRKKQSQEMAAVDGMCRNASLKK
jgi:hypothetical protein